MKKKAPLILFIFSLMFFSFGYGVVIATKRIPPYQLIQDALRYVSSLRTHWKHEFGLEPTRHLFAATDPDRPRLSSFGSDDVYEGYRMVVGFISGRAASFGALLIAPDGSEVHYWPIDYALLDPDGKRPWDVTLHGTEVFEDGSLVVNFDEGNVLARVGACGDVIWTTSGIFHHAVTKSYDGTLWTLQNSEGGSEDQFLVQLDFETGTVLRHLSLMSDVIQANNAEGIFWMRKYNKPGQLAFLPDPFHINDIEILGPATADSFPDFSPGDILVSLRNINLVAVLDGESLGVKWSRHGPWHRQHDPDFNRDGTISVFSNNMSLMNSEIIKIDPQSGRTRTLFMGTAETPFYTRIRGKHQLLENGNILIAESDGGRAFEVNAAGKIVWEFQNIFDKNRNAVVNKAMHLPSDYFDPDALSCTSSAQ